MNVALRLLMSGVSAPPPPALVRFKSVSGNATATFDEATPLDSSHLLVAVVTTEASSVTTPSGWTAIAVLSINSSARVGMYAHMGNGSINSVTITGASAADSTIVLMGISHISSATPIDWDTFDRNANATSQAISIRDSASGVGMAVCVLGLSNNPTAWGGWSGTELTAVVTPSASVCGTVATGAYLGGGGTLDSTVSWTGTFREPGYVWAIFQ